MAMIIYVVAGILLLLGFIKSTKPNTSQVGSTQNANPWLSGQKQTASEYQPNASVWAADQKFMSLGDGKTPPNPIIPWNTQRTPTSRVGPVNCPCCTASNTVGPIPPDCSPSSLSGANPSVPDLACPDVDGGYGPCVPSATGAISPTFWAADKVPVNPALQTDFNTMDANPTLDGNTTDMAGNTLLV